MLRIITFKGVNNRKHLIRNSETLRNQKVFHNIKLLKDRSIITYKDNVRGLEKLDLDN